MSEPHTNALHPAKTTVWQYVSGPLLTVVVVLAIELLARTVFVIPNPAVVLLLAVVFAALHGGILPGLSSAAIAWLYLAVFLSLPQQPLHYTDENFSRMVILAITVPAIATMIGILQRRAERAFEVAHTNAVLQAQLAEHQQAEEERQKLVALIAHSTDFIGVATLDKRVTYLNDAGCHLVGLDPRDVTQTTIFDYFSEETRTQVRETILPTVMASGKWQGETRLQHFTSGQSIPVDMIAFVVYHPATRQPLCLATVSRDSTERKNSEAARLTETRCLPVQMAILQAALSTLDPELLRTRLLDIVAQTQGYAHGLWWQLSADGQEVVVVATYGEEMAPFLGLRRALNDPGSFAAYTIRTARPQYCNRVQESPFAYHDITRPLGPQALLGWPLTTYMDQVSGALTFADTADPERFTAADLAQGATLATHIAQTIERSEFFDRLQRLEVQYRTVTESIHDGLLMVDLEGRITFANTALIQLLGRENTELLGCPSTDLYAPGVVPTAWERRSRARALQGEPVSPYFQAELLHRDGRQIAVELAIATLSHGGKTVGRVSVVRDIRWRLQVQAEMEQRRRETEILGELAHSLNASLELETVLQRVVEGAQELCGSDNVKIALWDPDERAMRFRYWVGQRYTGYAQLRVESGKGLGGYVIQTGHPISITNYAEDSRFSKDYLEVNQIEGFQAEIVMPIIIAQQVEGLLYAGNRSAHSFTEQHEASLQRLADHAAVAIRNARMYVAAERRQREAETLAELARTMNASLDLDTVLQQVVAGAQVICQSDVAILGLQEPNTDDVILRYWAGVGLAEAEPLRVEAGKGLGGQVMVTGQPIHTDHYATDARFGPDYLPVVRQRGTQAILAVPIRLSGRVVGLLYTANRTPHPFTDRDEAILLQLADHAAGAIRNAQLYKELDAFVYTASHDLKAPLVSIEGYAAILHQEFHAALGEQGQHYLARIRANVAHMHALITDLLELSRIGRALGVIEAIDVSALLREVQEELALALAQAGAELVVQAALPAVRGDRGRIRQVFVNLIDNAIKFRSRERRLRIEVGCQQERDYHRFHVADNGVGIAPRYHEQIFAPFRRLEAAVEGVGMGLTLVQKVVQYHGGRVWVESEAGAGATFYLTLPAMCSGSREGGINE